MALTERLLPQPGMPIMRTPFGYDFGAQAVAHLKQLAALHAAMLETLKASDLA